MSETVTIEQAQLHLVELARLREIPLPALLQQLGIKTPEPEYA